jgi:hypothetical protein
MSNVTQAVLEQQRKRAAQSSYEPTDLTKYFTIALEKGIQRGEKTFRILPDPINPAGSPFVEVYFHVIKVGDKQRKLYDPGKNEGKPSPLTEVYKELMATGDPNDKNIARDYKPRLYYVIRGIERGKEHEGIKFWRFPHDSKGSGAFDMISAIFNKFDDITDPLTGRDLSIQLQKVKSPRGQEYTNISTIIANDPSPLSADASLVQQWMADKSTWESVYKKYDYDYLQIVAEQGIPTWSEEGGGKWVAKTEADQTTSTSTSDNMAEVVVGAEVQADIPVVDDAAMHIPDDDLPF